MKEEEKVKKAPKTKQYKAIVTRRIGSNADGSAKITVTKDEILTLSASKAKEYRRLNLIK